MVDETRKKGRKKIREALKKGFKSGGTIGDISGGTGARVSVRPGRRGGGGGPDPTGGTQIVVDPKADRVEVVKTTPEAERIIEAGRQRTIAEREAAKAVAKPSPPRPIERIRKEVRQSVTTRVQQPAMQVTPEEAAEVRARLSAAPIQQTRFIPREGQEPPRFTPRLSVEEGAAIREQLQTKRVQQTIAEPILEPKKQIKPDISKGIPVISKVEEFGKGITEFPRLFGKGVIEIGKTSFETGAELRTEREAFLKTEGPKALAKKAGKIIVRKGTEAAVKPEVQTVGATIAFFTLPGRVQKIAGGIVFGTEAVKFARRPTFEQAGRTAFFATPFIVPRRGPVVDTPVSKPVKIELVRLKPTVEVRQVQPMAKITGATVKRTPPKGVFAEELPLFEPVSIKRIRRKELKREAREQTIKDILSGVVQPVAKTPSGIRKAFRKQIVGKRGISPLDTSSVGVFAKQLPLFEPVSLKRLRARERAREQIIREVETRQRGLGEVRGDIRKIFRRRFAQEEETRLMIAGRKKPTGLLADITKLTPPTKVVRKPIRKKPDLEPVTIKRTVSQPKSKEADTTRGQVLLLKPPKQQITRPKQVLKLKPKQKVEVLALQKKGAVTKARTKVRRPRSTRALILSKTKTIQKFSPAVAKSITIKPRQEIDARVRHKLKIKTEVAQAAPTIPEIGARTVGTSSFLRRSTTARRTAISASRFREPLQKARTKFIFPTFFRTKPIKKERPITFKLTGRFQPSIRAAGEIIRGPKPKLLTGLEVRPILART